MSGPARPAAAPTPAQSTMSCSWAVPVKAPRHPRSPIRHPPPLFRHPREGWGPGAWVPAFAGMTHERAGMTGNGRGNDARAAVAADEAGDGGMAWASRFEVAVLLRPEPPVERTALEEGAVRCEIDDPPFLEH